MSESMKRHASNMNCCAPHCSSRKGKNENLTFHRFPVNKVTKIKWICLLRIGRCVTDRMTVCSKHFQKSDYRIFHYFRDGMYIKKHFLKKKALPTKHLPKISVAKSRNSLKTAKTYAEDFLYSSEPDNESEVESEIAADTKLGPVEIYKYSPHVIEKNQDLNALLQHSEVISAVKTLYQFLSTVEMNDQNYKALKLLEDLARQSGNYAETMDMFFKPKSGSDECMIKMDDYLGGKKNHEMIALLMHSEVISALKTFYNFLAKNKNTQRIHLDALQHLECLARNNEDHAKTLRLFFEPESVIFPTDLL